MAYNHEAALDLVREHGLKPVMHAYMSAVRMFTGWHLRPKHAPNASKMKKKYCKCLDTYFHQFRRSATIAARLKKPEDMSELELHILLALCDEAGLPEVWKRCWLQQWSGLFPEGYRLSLIEDTYRIKNEEGQIIEEGPI